MGFAPMFYTFFSITPYDTYGKIDEIFEIENVRFFAQYFTVSVVHHGVTVENLPSKISVGTMTHLA